MRKLLILVLLASSLVTFGQKAKKIKKKLKKIDESERVQKLKSKYPEWQVELVSVNSESRTLNESVRNLKVGEMVTVAEAGKLYVYKLLEAKESREFRARYIYLNGDKLTKDELDSTRTLIIAKYNSGAEFTDLVKMFTMDGNTKGGDLGWFHEGAMVNEFETAMRDHKKGDIFYIDVVDNKWFYVTLKTHDDKVKRTFDLIKVKVGNK